MPTKHDGEWDENRGGPRHPNNLVSFPSDGLVHSATKNVWPWQPCGGHDQGRHVVPAAYLEAIFRRAPVPDPSSLAPVQMMVKCLGMPEYLDDALDLLIDEGIFKTEDNDGDTVDIVYELWKTGLGRWARPC